MCILKVDRLRRLDERGMELSVAEGDYARHHAQVVRGSTTAARRLDIQTTLALQADSLEQLRNAPGRWHQSDDQRVRCHLADGYLATWRVSAKSGLGKWGDVTRLTLEGVTKADQVLARRDST